MFPSLPSLELIGVMDVFLHLLVTVPVLRCHQMPLSIYGDTKNLQARWGASGMVLKVPPSAQGASVAVSI